ncbi:MAG: RNA polymerase sigma factor [Litorimonas sp.]
MTEKMTSEELASRAATGDAEAFRALLRLHYDRVFRVVFSVVKNQSDAEDISQDIWAAMPGKLRNWRGEAKLTSWLHRIAVNAAKDALRKSATRNRTTAGYIEVEALERGEAADTERRLSWLRSALETLSVDLRATAALTLGEQMNFAEAAEALGVAEGTVAWRMSEIRRRLKAHAAKDNGLDQEALA